MSDEKGRYEARCDELQSLARSFREAAANPAPTPLPVRWVEGFTDGMRFAAAVLDAVATGETQTEALIRAMASL